MKAIRQVNLDQTDMKQFAVCLADCVILTHDGKILMQRRPENWGSHPGVVNIFGGHVEEGESVVAGLLRELNEELGAVVQPDDLIFIGAVSEDITNHTEIVHVYFWHDKDQSITGCYEAEAITFEDVALALAHPKIMDYAAWALMECRRSGLIP